MAYLVLALNNAFDLTLTIFVVIQRVSHAKNGMR